MKTLKTAFTFSVLSIVLLGACSTSKKSITLPESQPQVGFSIASDTTQFIQVTINERVRYTFVKIDTSWSGNVIQYDNNDPTIRKVVRTINLIPSYGWGDFEDVIEFLKIYNLPDQEDIANRNPGPLTNISREYKVVVLNDGERRKYNYFNPEAELADNWQSQNIVTFSTYLINEMKALQQ